MKKMLNTKNNVVLYVDYFTEDENKNMIKTKNVTTKISRKKLEESILEDKANDIEHKIEYVNKKPDKIQFGVIYVLRTPKGHPDMIYVFQKD